MQGVLLPCMRNSKGFVVLRSHSNGFVVLRSHSNGLRCSVRNHLQQVIQVQVTQEWMGFHYKFNSCLCYYLLGKTAKTL
jgi:hypothetical protein